VITTTSGEKIQLNFFRIIQNNFQGVSTAVQVFGQQNSMNVQYYFIGYDTTNNSYQANFLELYALSWVNGNAFSQLVRIAYANLSINKQPNYDLFILWMIEFQNIPSYLLIFIPIIPGTPGVAPLQLGGSGNSSFIVYANNGNCNFTCGGNCNSNRPSNFMLSIQNNTIVLQIPVLVPIGGGSSSAQILICGTTVYNGITFLGGYGGPPYNVNSYGKFTLSSSYSTTIVPPSSGYIFFVLLAVITMIFTVS
jgi:hypothetical protein